MPDDAIALPQSVTDGRAIPDYLQETYWWAYIHPNAVTVFERQWMVNLILWGNFARLRDAALDALGQEIFGRTLQVACVYGDFSTRLTERLNVDASLDVVDILPIQLRNLASKLDAVARVHTHLRNSVDLGFDEGSYDQTVLFFLLHEQPATVRAQTLAEAVRVTRPGGRIVIVDYHLPVRSHPLRYLIRPILQWLEPFALDLWRQPISAWLPDRLKSARIEKHTYFGGLYQRLVIEMPS